jgi:hypothetical protein
MTNKTNKKFSKTKFMDKTCDILKLSKKKQEIKLLIKVKK